jgi:dTDP-glucose 4,6-dehydratase
MAGKTYVILGGGGSFGVNTALHLLASAAPARVIGVGRSPLRPEPFTLGVDRDPRYEYRELHVWNDREELMDLFDEVQPDVIVNYAAQGEGAASWAESWRFFETNSVALSWLHEELERRAWFSQGHSPRFIHIGTSELYGSVCHPAREDASIRPSSPYAASKAAFDLYLLAMKKQGYARTTTILRPSNCYCPGQLLHRIIPRAVVCGLTGRKLPLHGGGAAEKSYMHVRDLARAIHLVSEADVGDLRPVYNVGPGDPISIRDLAHLVAQAVDVRFEDLFEEVGERVGQDGRYWLDSWAIKDDLGWYDDVPLREGLLEVVEWGRKYIDVLKDWPQDYTLRP